jgi:hypothetical protein
VVWLRGKCGLKLEGCDFPSESLNMEPALEMLSLPINVRHLITRDQDQKRGNLATVMGGAPPLLIESVIHQLLGILLLLRKSSAHR